MTERDFFENAIKIVVGKREKREITNIPKDRLCAQAAVIDGNLGSNG